LIQTIKRGPTLSKSLIFYLPAGAAVAGLLTGSVAVRAYAATTLSNPGISLQTMADAEKVNTPAKAIAIVRTRAAA